MANSRYRSGDRVFALLPDPDVVLSLTCQGPVWTASVFDFKQKKVVAADESQKSCDSAKEFVLGAVKTCYGVAVSEVQWQVAPGGRSDGPQG